MALLGLLIFCTSRPVWVCAEPLKYASFLKVSDHLFHSGTRGRRPESRLKKSSLPPELIREFDVGLSTLKMGATAVEELGSMYSKAAKTDSTSVAAMLVELHRELEVEQGLAEFQSGMAVAMEVNLAEEGPALIRFDRLTQAITEVAGADRDPKWASTWAAYLGHCRPNVYLPARARVFLTLDQVAGEVRAIELPYGVAPFSHFLELPDMHGVTATFEGWHQFERRLLELFEEYDPESAEDKLWLVRLAAQGLLFAPQEWTEFVGEHPALWRATQSPILARLSDKPLMNAYDPERHVRMDLEGVLRLMDQHQPMVSVSRRKSGQFWCMSFSIQDETA